MLSWPPGWIACTQTYTVAICQEISLCRHLITRSCAQLLRVGQMFSAIFSVSCIFGLASAASGCDTQPQSSPPPAETRCHNDANYWDQWGCSEWVALNCRTWNGQVPGTDCSSSGRACVDRIELLVMSCPEACNE